MKAKVIAVHGTYVADVSDRGEQWWQKGGALQRFLGEQMPDAIDAGDLIVFHWSGDNSATARQKAGSELFRQMLTLEREDAPYHVVAHSHGGGVLLEALMDAVEYRGPSVARFLGRAAGRSGAVPEEPRTRGPEDPLPGLLSWTTVGTPFLSASPQPHWSNRLRNPYRMLVALLLAIVNLGILIGLLTLPSPAVAIVLLLVLLQTTALSGRLSANGFLLARLDARTEAMRRFGDRWLPLWSRGDEALTSLTVTVPKLQLRLVKPMRPTINPHTPLRSIIRWPLAFAIAQSVNLVRPQLNRTAAATLRRALQGYDHPFGEVVSIGAGPLPPFDDHPSLPPRVDEELIENANNDAQKGIAAVRSMLYTVANAGADMQGFAASLRAQLAGGELVHTRYFDHPGVLRLIELHMRGTCGELPAWFAAMRESIDAAVAAAGVQSSPWIWGASSSGSSFSWSSSRSGSM
jgi:hypothetical protein